MTGPLLRVRDLTATVTTRREVIQAVRGISFDINADEAVGFVKACMEVQPFPAFDVPIIAEAAYGESFGELKEMEDV